MEARTWPLTGRDEELRSVAAALRRTEGPRGLVLAGAAGVGKTRLAREVLRMAAVRGMATRWAVATVVARELPLGAFAGLLGELEGDQLRLVQRAGASLVAGHGPAGVVVGVDDAHLLDGVSALLVQQMVIQQQAAVVVTVRTGESAPDAVIALWKDGLLDRLELRPLSEPETLELLESVLGGQVDTHSAGRLWRLTQGNALFLREIVEAELAGGRLREVSAVWRWTGAPMISPKLAELAALRMGALPPPVREVVDVLALGEPLDTRVLARLTDPAAMESADERGLIVVDEGAWARLAHPLYCETRRAGIGRLRARRLRGDIATELLLSASVDADVLLRRAVLMLESDLEPVAALFTAAGQVAFRRLDMALAERLARAAIAAGGGFDARLTLAYTLAWQSRPAEAQIEFAKLAGLAGTDIERAVVAATRAGNLFNILRQPGRAQDVLDAAKTTVSDPGALAVLDAMRAVLHFWCGRPERAVAVSTALLKAGTAPAPAIVRAACGLVGGLGVIGKMDTLDRAIVSDGYAGAARSLDGAMQVVALTTAHLAALRLAGNLAELGAVERDQRRHTSGAVGVIQLIGAFLQGYAWLAHGQIRRAARILREIRSGLPGVELGLWECLSKMYLAQALAVAGDAAAAREALGDTDSSWHPGMVVLEPELVLTRAWLAAAEGSVSEAIALAHHAADVAAEFCQSAHEVLALHTAACFGDRTVASRLVNLATLVDGPRAPAAAAHAAALADRDGAGLLAASQRFEEMGDRLVAADAAAQAAIAYRGQDRHGSATTAAARAYRLAEECGSRTPALLAAAHPLPLTEREREIVALAADGLSNRQIADRLTLSIRTIEGHLYRAGAKLGTSKRTDYANLLRETLGE